MLKKSLSVLLTALLICTLAGCDNKPGRMQRLGEKADNAKEKVQDTVNPKGPLEKTGREADKALDAGKSDQGY